MGEKRILDHGQGERLVEPIGVSLPGTATRSPLARPCLDWTERRPHLAGRLAARTAKRVLRTGMAGANFAIPGRFELRIAATVKFERHYRVNLRMVPPCLRP